MNFSIPPSMDLEADHIDRIASLLENGSDVDVIYLDFAKAFDKVDIGITLRKLIHLALEANWAGGL